MKTIVAQRTRSRSGRHPAETGFSVPPAGGEARLRLGLQPKAVRNILGVLAACVLQATALPAAETPPEYPIPVFVGGLAKPFPVAMSGYTGEVEKVLRFDLEIAGFKFVPEADAHFVLQGNNNGQVEGRLSDAINKSPRFNKVFTGGAARTQAHALSDEVVLAVTGVPGVARTKIAFKVTRGQNSEIYVADYDGHNATPVTSDNTVVAAPNWLPKQRALFYTTYKFGNADIVSHDLDTGARKIVARYGGSNISPAASPDGRHVAMILSKSGSPDLFVANSDGSGLRQLTQTREDESSPCWSPDGRWIAYATRGGDGRRILAKIPATGGAMQRVPISDVINPSEPEWSPDGKYIAFTSQMRDFQLCLLPAQGGEAHLLVPGEDASWAPNSRTLLFVRRGAGGKRVLSLLDVPTRQSKDVAQNLGVCTQPTWSR
jgi:TolB protein